MSAAEALKAARAAGIRLGIDGDALTLEACEAPSPSVLGLLLLLGSAEERLDDI